MLCQACRGAQSREGERIAIYILMQICRASRHAWMYNQARFPSPKSSSCTSEEALP